MKTNNKNLIEYHLNAIAEIYGGWSADWNKQGVWRNFKQNENLCRKLAIIYCGDGSANQEEHSRQAEAQLNYYKENLPRILSKYFVNKELFKEHFYINEDPRGYALKLAVPRNIVHNAFHDLGDNVILAPEDLKNAYPKIN